MVLVLHMSLLPEMKSRKSIETLSCHRLRLQPRLQLLPKKQTKENSLNMKEEKGSSENSMLRPILLKDILRPRKLAESRWTA